MKTKSETTVQSPRTAQILDHVGQVAYERARAFSFCFGRGWRAHSSLEIAQRAAARDVRAAVRRHGGGAPQSLAIAKAKGGAS